MKGPLPGPRRYDYACRECGRTDCAGPNDHARVVALEDAMLRLIASLRDTGAHEAGCAITAYRRDYLANVLMDGPMSDAKCDCIMATPTEPT